MDYSDDYQCRLIEIKTSFLLMFVHSSNTETNKLFRFQKFSFRLLDFLSYKNLQSTLNASSFLHDIHYFISILFLFILGRLTLIVDTICTKLITILH